MHTMETRIAKVDNDLAIRLPADMVRDLGLQEGERITVRRIGSRISVERAGVPSLDDLLRTVKEPEAELDSGPPIGREVIV